MLGLHFSVDDVFDALLEREHPLHALCAELHQRFAVATDLYVFQARERRTLESVADRPDAELRQATWLRLGPHGLDAAHPPYRQAPAEQAAMVAAIYREIERFAGPGKRSAWVRLHCFSEAYELAPVWRAHGVTTLLLTDRPAVAYRLPAAARAQLEARGQVEHAGLTLRRTHERIESLVGLPAEAVRARLWSHLARHGFLTLMTHEVELLDAAVRAACRQCLEVACGLGAVDVRPR